MQTLVLLWLSVLYCNVAISCKSASMHVRARTCPSKSMPQELVWAIEFTGHVSFSTSSLFCASSSLGSPCFFSASLQKSTQPLPVVSVDAASETQLGRAPPSMFSSLPPSWLSCLRSLMKSVFENLRSTQTSIIQRHLQSAAPATPSHHDAAAATSPCAVDLQRWLETSPPGQKETPAHLGQRNLLRPYCPREGARASLDLSGMSDV